ncbi:MAG TPA: hypothetical protein VKP69_32815, partial [Isosphaeraceae bacterium]|nr:hypothetical protein [Isosphaeraceae bacterium]
GAWVTVGPDHSVDVFWLDQSAGSGTPNIIKMRKSTDLGVTFGAPVTVATLSTTGINGGLGLTFSNTNSSPFRSNAFPEA